MARVNAVIVVSLLFASAALAQSGEVPSRTQLEKERREERPLAPLGGLKVWREGTKLESPAQESLRIDAWRREIIQLPRPKKGCFQSSYPDMAWQEVPCTTPPPYPMVPRRAAARPFTIGDGNNVSAEVPTASSFISSATGSFDSVTGVTSVSSPIGNTGAPVNNAYTLQVNTNFFASTACAGSPNTNCQGWQQFVFANNGTAGSAFIQYWLLQYNTNCPSGWNQFSFTGDTDIYCYRNNSAGAVATPNQPITNLAQMNLTGTVSASADSVTYTSGTNVYSVTGDNSVNAAAGWDTAEFGALGYGGNSDGGGDATFNNGSTIVARTRILYGGTTAPNCVADGFTAETNNLSFGPTAPGATGPGPAVFSTQSSAGGAVSNCAAATSVGDTHLTTFGGMLYDFQASGDFVLAQIDPDFVVQARQVSGAPTWPNASVNSAVGMQMGKTKVSICLEPEQQILVDGRPVEIEDGKPLELPDAADILRLGNVYFVRGARGHSVRIVLNNGWMNVSVGLGRWPVDVRGLLFSTEKFGLETRKGEVLTSPFSFKDVYHVFGESWRVSPKESLLSVCGDGGVKEGIPDSLFYADDLNDELYKRARAICAEAGVTEQTLLEACALDVTVIGDVTAARVFAGAPPPVAVMRPTP